MPLPDELKKASTRKNLFIVKAHRFYQFAMCLYKVWRYKDGADLLEKSRNRDGKQPKHFNFSINRPMTN